MRFVEMASMHLYMAAVMVLASFTPLLNHDKSGAAGYAASRSLQLPNTINYPVPFRLVARWLRHIVF